MLNESKFKMYDQLRATVKLPNINRNTDFLSKYCNDNYWTIFLLLNPPVNTDNNLFKVYTKKIAVKKEGIKKSQIVWWRVSFTDDFTNRINPTVKFICEYVDKILSSVYTDDSIRGITVRFKKTNYFLKPFFLLSTDSYSKELE